jgi:hypothetical protein
MVWSVDVQPPALALRLAVSHLPMLAGQLDSRWEPWLAVFVTIWMQLLPLWRDRLEWTMISKSCVERTAAMSGCATGLVLGLLDAVKDTHTTIPYRYRQSSFETRRARRHPRVFVPGPRSTIHSATIRVFVLLTLSIVLIIQHLASILCISSRSSSWTHHSQATGSTRSEHT